MWQGQVTPSLSSSPSSSINAAAKECRMQMKDLSNKGAAFTFIVAGQDNDSLYMLKPTKVLS